MRKTLARRRSPLESDAGSPPPAELHRTGEAVASILSSILLPPPATGLSVIRKPEHPVEGGNVTLTPQGFSGSFISCAWYSGGGATEQSKQIIIYYPLPSPRQDNGAAYTGRETSDPTCSLRISNLTLRDSGEYTVKVQKQDDFVKGSRPTEGKTRATLQVSENLDLHRPVLKPSEVMMPENSYVTLKCNTSKSDGVNVFWFKNAEPLLAVAGLSDRNRTLNITGVSKNDAGTYTCEARNPVSKGLSNPSSITVAFPAPAAPSPAPLQGIAIAGIVLGLLVGATLIGSLFYFFLCARGRSVSPASAQSASAPSMVYDNVSHGVQGRVESSSDLNHPYQTLEYGDQAVYHELKYEKRCIQETPHFSLLLPPAAGLSVTQEPANLTEGGNVTLTPQGIPDSFIMNCGWFRGETTDRANRIFIYYPPPSPRGQINGAANTGRERRVPTCSLRISDLMLNYSGVYTVVVTLASAAPAKASVKIAVSGVRGRSDPSSTQAVSAYSIYENISPSGQVKAEGSLDSNHTTYQRLAIPGSSPAFEGEAAWRGLAWLASPPSPPRLISRVKRTSRAPESAGGAEQRNPGVRLVASRTLVDGRQRESGREGGRDPGVRLRKAHHGEETGGAPESRLDTPAVEELVAGNAPSSRRVSPSAGSCVSPPGTAGPGAESAPSASPSLLTSGSPSSSRRPACGETPATMGRQAQEGPRRSSWGGSLGWRRSSWPAALLAVSLLLPPPAAGLSVTQDPANPEVGGSVTLTPQGLSDPFVSCTWFRGEATDLPKRIFTYYPPPSLGQVNGDAYTERDTRVPPCSLRISDLMLNYSGIYTLQEDSAKPVKVSVNLTVSENLDLHRPVLKPSEVMVPENSYVTLKCNTSKSDGVSVFWFKNAEPLLAVTSLLDRNRTLNITGVSRNDAGTYTCEARNPVSKGLSNPSSITVAYGPDNLKLNQEGSIQQQIGSTLLLECTEDSVPEAQFQWWLNNTQLNKTGRSYTTQLTWEDEGNYTCQATNPFTKHSASASVYVTLTKDAGPISSGLSGGAIAGVVLGSLAGIALIGGLLYLFLCTRIWSDKTPTQTAAAPSVYENVFPSGQVKAETSSDPNHTYESLQHGDRAVYDQLKW
ncbi:uncharacterized protein LOC128332878 [Hemicordylus capensis]|uniref:uncharacterized protein LOC128332878 n=1 Tax=Hemicordylus capensis TaxID=884348 RepID=UPI0023034205|nr:uncharacterized protein LOC128332878 [Hemicordylus capensis]